MFQVRSLIGCLRLAKQSLIRSQRRLIIAGQFLELFCDLRGGLNPPLVDAYLLLNRLLLFALALDCGAERCQVRTKILDAGGVGPVESGRKVIKLVMLLLLSL